MKKKLLIWLLAGTMVLSNAPMAMAMEEVTVADSVEQEADVEEEAAVAEEEISVVDEEDIELEEEESDLDFDESEEMEDLELEGDETGNTDEEIVIDNEADVVVEDVKTVEKELLFSAPDEVPDFAVEMPANAETLTPGVLVSKEISYERSYFKITVDRTGVYEFYSKSNGDEVDTFGELYCFDPASGLGELMSYDDDGGYDYNEEMQFRIRAELETGKTYYLAVRTYDEDGRGSANIGMHRKELTVQGDKYNYLMFNTEECEQPVQLAVDAVSYESEITYAWYKRNQESGDYEVVSGETGAALTIIPNRYQEYQCVVRADSDEEVLYWEIEVDNEFEVSLNHDYYYDATETGTATIVADASVRSGSVRYTWLEEDIENGGYYALPETSNTLHVTGVTKTRRYWLRAEDDYGNACHCDFMVVYCKVHDWQLDYEEPSTCTEHGFREYYCNNCDTYKEEPLPLAPHTFSNDVCTYCGTYRTPVVSKAENGVSGVNVTWGRVAGVQKYRVYRRTAGGSWTTVGDSTATAITDTTAVSGTTYYYTVRCLSADGRSFISSFDPTGKSVLCLSSVKPTLANGTTGVNLTWTKVTGANGYAVYRKNGTAGYTKIATISGGATTSYIDTKATSGVTYTYAVRAYNGTTMGSFTAMSLLYLSSVKATAANGTTGANLTWTKVTGAAGYNVYRKSGTAGYTKIATINNGATVSYIDTKATSGVTYTYAVRAFNGTTMGSFTAATLVYLAAPNHTVTNAITGVQIKWSSIAGATGYRIYRKAGTGAYAVLKDVTGSTTSYVDTTAASGTNYTYAVRAMKTAGSVTTMSNFTGKAVTFLKSVTPTLSNITAGVKITWTKVTGATGYAIYRKTGTAGYTKIATISGGATVTYTDTVVKNNKGTAYTYAVRAVSGSTMGSFTAKSITRR